MGQQFSTNGVRIIYFCKTKFPFKLILFATSLTSCGSSENGSFCNYLASGKGPSAKSADWYTVRQKWNQRSGMALTSARSLRASSSRSAGLGARLLGREQEKILIRQKWVFLAVSDRRRAWDLRQTRCMPSDRCAGRASGVHRVWRGLEPREKRVTKSARRERHGSWDDSS